jgi:hypothetical protein
MGKDVVSPDWEVVGSLTRQQEVPHKMTSRADAVSIRRPKGSLSKVSFKSNIAQRQIFNSRVHNNIYYNGVEYK